MPDERGCGGPKVEAIAGQICDHQFSITRFRAGNCFVEEGMEATIDVADELCMYACIGE